MLREGLQHRHSALHLEEFHKTSDIACLDLAERTSPLCVRSVSKAAFNIQTIMLDSVIKSVTYRTNTDVYLEPPRLPLEIFIAG